ncbi:PREDICTED: proteinase inhibitor [Camelina sativa]|uniref:Proteinase inhibitor n=1 Tax=Camelina sativa TaxID=90675 RepID=A0ABM1QGI1_CAMSA|nr:PREDICTED: proteinase inhibitor [Camelina sativa]
MAPYPPCWSGACEDPECCARGKKCRWPELVGKSGEIAKMTIERENQNVLAIVLRARDGRIDNFCCNRVFVGIDTNGNVLITPQIG